MCIGKFPEIWSQEKTGSLHVFGMQILGTTNTMPHLNHWVHIMLGHFNSSYGYVLHIYEDNFGAKTNRDDCPLIIKGILIWWSFV